jgi:hypothetical protein
MASVATDHFFSSSRLSIRLPIALLLRNRCSLSTLIAHVSRREGWIGTNYSGQSLEHCFLLQAVYMYEVSYNCHILVFVCSCSTCNPPVSCYSLWLTNCWDEKRYQWKTNEKTPWPESASELYRPSDHRLLAKIVPTFAARAVSRS